MDKKDKESRYQSQMENKPKIDDLIVERLEGGLKVASSEFLGFIKSLKMTPQWYATDSFSVNYQGKRVCIIKIHDGDWWIWSYTRYNNEFDSGLASESVEMQQAVINSMVYCQGCGGCAPGEEAVIMGIIRSGLCRMPVLRFQNPNMDELEYAKKLVILRRRAIANHDVPKVSYIAMSKRNNG